MKVMRDLLKGPHGRKGIADASSAASADAGDRQASRDVTELPASWPDRRHVWAFNAGQKGDDFRGNPKYLFIYINNYRPDILAWWLCMSEETAAFVRSLGFRAYAYGTVEAESMITHTGVFAVEMVKNNVFKGMEQVTYLNLYHGVGTKKVERALRSGRLAETLARKYITNSTFYRNNQILLCPSPMMEEELCGMCGVDRDHVVRGGYPRNLYQRSFERFSSFDHDLRARKGLSGEWALAVYAPTFRHESDSGLFHRAVPDMERLVRCCEENRILLIFKMHPFLEDDPAFVRSRERYADCPYVWFWDNGDDFYEIIDQIDLAIVDYSSIFTDLLDAGVGHFIRYVFDYDEAAPIFDADYLDLTAGELCYSFDELLGALSHWRGRDDSADLARIRRLYWEWSGGDTFEDIIGFTLGFEPTRRTFPVLYSFDVFDTLISRRGLAPESIFYKVQEGMRASGLGFDEAFIRGYPALRRRAEQNAREYYSKTLEDRASERREIRFEDIFTRLQDVYGLTDAQAAWLAQAELDAEYADSVPVEGTIERVRGLVARGETVVLVSDMYLPREFVERLLSKADPVLGELPLFLSSDVGVQKTTGKLYLAVYNSFEPYYEFDAWRHVGDNRYADLTRPRKLGIRAELLDAPRFDRYEQALVDELGTYDAYLVAALMARFRAGHVFQREQFSYGYASLLFVPYVCWVLEDAAACGYETLYFIARDGYHLKRIADAAISALHLPLKTKYLYGSRTAWRIPALIDDVDEEFWGGHGNFVQVETYDELLNAAALDGERFCELLPEFSYLKEQGSVSKEERTAVVAALKASPAYREQLLALARERRVSVCGYLAQEIDFSERFAFVEYWGRGYTQKSLTTLLKDMGAAEETCFYYSRSILPSEPGCTRRNFTTATESEIFVEALFANMPYTSVEGYEERDGRWEPVVQENPALDRELFADMERCLVQFTEDYLALEVHDRGALGRALHDFGLGYYHRHEGDRIYVEVLGPLVYSGSIYGTTREFAPAFTEEVLDEFSEGRPRGEFSRSLSISYARSTEDMREEYLRRFQLKDSSRVSAGSCASEEGLALGDEYRARLEELEEHQRARQQAYDGLVRQTGVRDKVLLMTDGRRLIDAVFRGLRRELEDQDVLRVEEVCAGGAADEEDILRSVAEARFIVSAKPLEFLSGLKLRSGTETIVLNESAFPFSGRTYGNVWQRSYEERRLSEPIGQLMAASEALVPFLSRTYGVRDASSFRLRGCCRTDVYSDSVYVAEARSALEEAFPEAAGRRVLLYLPTVRYRTVSSGYKYFLDMERLQGLLGGDWVVAVHASLPKGEFTQPLEVEGFSRNVTRALTMPQALCAADVVVGDYRDTFFEVPLLRKPAYQLVNDAYSFLKGRRNICSLEEALIGPVVHDERELAVQLGDIDAFDYSLEDAFRERWLTDCDGRSSERVAAYMLERVGQA